MSDSELLNFIPLVGVGKYRFGEPIDDYIGVNGLKLDENDGEYYDGDIYVNQNEDVSVYVDANNNIAQVMCDSEFFYKGQNIIGISLEEVVAFLGQEPDDFHDPIEMPDGSVEAGVYFFGLGLALGLQNDRHGPVENAYAYVAEDEEDEG